MKLSDKRFYPTAAIDLDPTRVDSDQPTAPKIPELNRFTNAQKSKILGRYQIASGLGLMFAPLGNPGIVPAREFERFRTMVRPPETVL